MLKFLTGALLLFVVVSAVVVFRPSWMDSAIGGASAVLTALAWWEIASLSALFTVWAAACIRQIPEYTGAIVVRFGKPVRSRGPGLSFVFWPFEWIGETATLKEQNIDDWMSVETGGGGRPKKKEEIVKLDFSIEYHPVARKLVQFLSFTQDQLQGAIKQRVKSLLSIEGHKRKDREELVSRLPDVQKAVQDAFNGSHGDQYAVKIRFLIDDPEPPKELAEAMIRTEVQEKENERRELEEKKMLELAEKLVKKAEKHGEKLSIDAAMKRVQVQFKIVPESHQNNNYNVGDQLLQTGKEVILGVASMMKKDSGKRQGGKHGRP